MTSNTNLFFLFFFSRPSFCLDRSCGFQSNKLLLFLLNSPEERR